MSSINFHHQNHALGDEMHIFTLLWFLQKSYDHINIHIDYALMNRSRGAGYSGYIRPFIEALYSKIPNVNLYHNSKKGMSKERLGRLVKPRAFPKLPDLFDLKIIPVMQTAAIVTFPFEEYIVVPTRIRYPPNGIRWDSFVELIGKLSKQYRVVLIGEQKLDKENKQIFTIYGKLVDHFTENGIYFVDLTAKNNLYKGESKLEHLYRDLNVIKGSKFMITVGISGFIDICSLITKVYTVGKFNQPHTKLIWNNPGHLQLKSFPSFSDMTKWFAN